MYTKKSWTCLLVAVLSLCAEAAWAEKIPTYSAVPAGYTQTGRWLWIGDVQFNTDKSPISVGNNSSGVERLFSRKSGTADVKLSFTGCIPKTAQSNQWIGLSKPEAAFATNPNADPYFGVDISFATTFTNPDELWILRNDYLGYAAILPIPASAQPPVTDGKFCAQYRLERVGGVVKAYIGSTEVFSAPSFYPAAPLMASVQSWDTAFSFSSVAWHPGKLSLAFSDSFEGTELDTEKWEVQPLPYLPGNTAQVSVLNGKMRISNTGGSCGTCGIADGALLIPQVEPQTGDFKVEVDMKEISRTAVAGQPTLTAFGLNFVGDVDNPFATSRIGISFGGDNYPNIQGQYNNHGFEFASFNANGSLNNWSMINVDRGVLYAAKMRLIRKNGICRAEIKLAGGEWSGPTWTQACGTEPLTPILISFSGDGHSNSINASAVVDVKRVDILAE